MNFLRSDNSNESLPTLNKTSIFEIVCKSYQYRIVKKTDFLSQFKLQHIGPPCYAIYYLLITYLARSLVRQILLA